MSKFINDNKEKLDLFKKLNGRSPYNGDEFAYFCEFVNNHSVMSKGNIEECFTEDAIRELTDSYKGGFSEADFWDGDETDKIQY
jgi:hypothetical protein